MPPYARHAVDQSCSISLSTSDHPSIPLHVCNCTEIHITQICITHWGDVELPQSKKYTRARRKACGSIDTAASLPNEHLTLHHFNICYVVTRSMLRPNAAPLQDSLCRARLAGAKLYPAAKLCTALAGLLTTDQFSLRTFNWTTSDYWLANKHQHLLHFHAICNL